MDGTLLKKDKSVSEKTIQTIKELKKEGIEFTIATGRIYPSVRSVVKTLEISQPLILCNGAIIQDSVTGEIYFSKAIDPVCAIKILEIMEEAGLYFYFYTQDALYCKEIKYTAKIHYEESKKEPLATRIKFCVIKDIKEVKNIPIYKIVVIEEDLEKLQEARKRMDAYANTISVVSSYSNNIEIVANTVSKGKGIEFLIDNAGYDRENIMCIGDEENDESMILEAGFAVAMGNANPKLKELADFITRDNEHDGISVAMQEFARRRKCH